MKSNRFYTYSGLGPLYDVIEGQELKYYKYYLHCLEKNKLDEFSLSLSIKKTILDLFKTPSVSYKRQDLENALVGFV